MNWEQGAGAQMNLVIFESILLFGVNPDEHWLGGYQVHLSILFTGGVEIRYLAHVFYYSLDLTRHVRVLFFCFGFCFCFFFLLLSVFPVCLFSFFVYFLEFQ